jgi:hypothetical protein
MLRYCCKLCLPACWYLSVTCKLCGHTSSSSGDVQLAHEEQLFLVAGQCGLLLLSVLLMLLLLLLPGCSGLAVAASLCDRISSGDMAFKCFLICVRIAFFASSTVLCSAATVVTGACIVLQCK